MSTVTDKEVEETLREIRERVRAESMAVAAAPREGGNAVVESGGAAHAPGDVPAVNPARDRLEANLAAMERTRDRLPPLTSYRAGAAARLELWVKRQIKRATHWFTWEQVNFNSAATHALRDALAALDAAEARQRRDAAALAEQAAALAAQAAALAELRAVVSEMSKQGGHIRAHFTSEIATLRRELEAVRSEQAERASHLAEEMRVSFRQLNLEATETAVAFDRARRGSEARLEALALRLEETERAAKRDA